MKNFGKYQLEYILITKLAKQINLQNPEKDFEQCRQEAIQQLKVEGKIS